jgi:hypothetical protein
MRKPPAKPRHKVPAPQANGVAARLRPPPGARAGRAGGLFAVRSWLFQGGKKCYFGGFKKVSGSRFQVSGIRNALLDDGCWRLTGGGRWGAFSWLFKVIKVILREFWGGRTMSVVRDPDARWRASVPTARRGRKHARARVLPGKALTADCGAGVLGGGFMTG